MMRRAHGAYSLAIMTADTLFAARDPLGVRPLCLGRLGESWIVASETCALEHLGATTEREVAPGEVLRIDERGPRGFFPLGRSGRTAGCTLEYVYFARPDSRLSGELIYLARERLGEELARERPPPASADLVIGVPDSGIPAAIGFARAAGLPYRDGLVKNRYVGRTFIQPDQRIRDAGVALKLNAMREVLEGRRVVVVDDSIVRGTTKPRVMELLRRAGAEEVHVRIASAAHRRALPPGRGHGHARGADRGQQHGARDPRPHRRRFARLPERGRAGARHAPPGGRALQRLLHEPLPDGRAGPAAADGPARGRLTGIPRPRRAVYCAAMPEETPRQTRTAGEATAPTGPPSKAPCASWP